MYKKFKDCLLYPSRISNYINENSKKFVLYFLLLLTIYIIPSVVNLVKVNKMPVEYSTVIINAFDRSPKVDYAIDNYELKPTNSMPTYQQINVGMTLLTYQKLVFVFSPDDKLDYEKFEVEKEENIGTIIIGFTKSGICIDDTFGNYLLKGKVIPYEKLGLKKLDFSTVYENEVNFKNELDDAFLSVYNKFKLVIIPVGIISVLLFYGASFAIEIIIMALIIKLFFRGVKVAYSDLCKIVLLCYTPQVVFNLLSIIYSSIFLYIIGQIITVIYVIRVVNSHYMSNLAKRLKDQLDKMNDDRRE